MKPKPQYKDSALQIHKIANKTLLIKHRDPLGQRFPEMVSS